MVTLTNKQLVNALVQLKLYYAPLSGEKGVKQNYFLMGFREKYAVVNPLAVSDTILRLRSFLLGCSRIGAKKWVVGFQKKEANLVRWLAGSTFNPYFLFLARRGCLIYFGGRHFWINHRFFYYKILQFLGVDVVILPSLGGSELFMTTLDSAGIVSIGLVSPERSSSLTYSLVCSTGNASATIFYLRLLRLFLV